MVFLWLSGLLLLRVGVLSSLPPWFVGTLLIMTAVGVLGVAGLSAYKEGRKTKEKAKQHRVSVAGGLSECEDQIEMTGMAAVVARDAASSVASEASLPEPTLTLPDGWLRSTDPTSGEGYLTFTDNIQFIWEGEVLSLAKYIEANTQQPDDSPPTSAVEADAESSTDEEMPAHRPTHASTTERSSSVADASSALELDELFSGGSTGMERQADDEVLGTSVWSSNANPLHSATT